MPGHGDALSQAAGPAGHPALRPGFQTRVEVPADGENRPPAVEPGR